MRAPHLLWCTPLLLFALGIAFPGCKKDDKDCPTNSAPVDGRDQFVGQYKVYDTTGTYLYSMEILKANDAGKDSVFAVNWGGRFDLYIQHYDGDLTNGLNLIPPFPSFDHLGNRWAFFADSDPVFLTNQLVNDTLRMSYEVNNIAFYAEDGVPFFTWSYREYGVKQ